MTDGTRVAEPSRYRPVTPAELRVEDVSCTIGGRTLVSSVRLDVEPGQVVGLIGPNGAGKSTLLRSVYRVRRPSGGRVLLDGADVWRLPTRTLARRMAAVPQENVADFDLTVAEVVAMGRTPHKRMFDGDSPEDRRLLTTSLELVDAADLADRSYPPLSGGEKQRVLLARALTQQPALLVLDEPTNNLDIRHQLDVLTLLRHLGVSVLAALHDLNLAAMYCDTLYVLARGQIVASGPPAAVLTADLLAEVYRVNAEVSTHPATGAPHVVLLPR